MHLRLGLGLLLVAGLAACDAPTKFDHGNPVDPRSEKFVPQPPGAMTIAYDGRVVTLNWSDDSDHERGYLIERALDPAADEEPAFEEVDRVAANVTTYQDEVDFPGFIAYYRVVSFNERNGAVQRLEETAPVRHVDLYGYGQERPVPTPITEQSVRITWADPFSFETGFEVQRKLYTEDAPYETIATVPADSTSYLETDLAFNHKAWYRVRALYGERASSFSKDGGVNWGAMGLPAPANVRAEHAGDRAVKLTWDADARAVEYNVSRRANNSGPFEPIASLPAGASSYTDATVDPAVGVYSYRVKTRYSPFSTIADVAYLQPMEVAASWTTGVRGGGGWHLAMQRTADPAQVIVSGQAAVETWNLETRQRTHRFDLQSAYHDIAVDASGETLVTAEYYAGRQGVYEYDAATGALVNTLAFPGATVTDLTLSPDGKTLVVDADGQHVWTRTGDGWTFSHALQLGDVAGGLAFHPSGDRLLALVRPRQSRGTLHELTLATGQSQTDYFGNAGRYSSGGRYLGIFEQGRVDTQGNFYVYDAATGEREHLWFFDKDPYVTAPIVFSPDETLFAGGIEEGQVAVWNIEAGRLQMLSGSVAKPLVAAFFREDNTTLVTLHEDAVVRIWHPAAARWAQP